MGQRYNLYLLFIVVLLALVVWIALPNNPGIHIGSFNKPLDTQLGLDLRGGLRVLMEVPGSVNVTPQQLNDAKSILENRANGLGVSEVNFTTAGARRIVGEFPGLTNTTEVINVLKETGQLAFVPTGSNPPAEGSTLNVDLSLVDKGMTPDEIIAAMTPAAAGVTPAAGAATSQPTAAPTAAATPAATEAAGAAAQATPAPTGTTPGQQKYYAIMTGADLKTDQIGVTRTTTGQYEINFVLTDKGAKTFADYTSKHVGEFLAIVLDNKVISAPRVNSAITQGSGVIQGSFTNDSANALAVQLRYGSLPVPLTIAQSSAVGATLGQDSINKSVRAGVIGLIMVIAFMILSYRLPGVLASLALLLYALTTYALFKLIPVTLTLPGIAGFVLSIGVAVDANILIFERMKEELRSGRQLRQAIELGWSRAWPSIRDSNISTIITCIVLFIFGNAYGASIIKGFALTLGLGVVVSLFTALFVTRTFLHVTLDNLKFAEHPRWFAA